MEKYEHIIEIGKELDAIDEKSKVDDKSTSRVVKAGFGLLQN